MDKISVLIPAYQVEKYLRRCLDSVVEQVYPNVEVIIINDGSFDQTEVIMNDYAEKYSWIRAITVEHMGLSTVRNRLLEESTGEYIFFLDADDFLDPEALQILYNVSQKYGAEIVQCEMESTSENTLYDTTDRGLQLYSREEALSAYNRTPEGPRCMSAGKLYKREVFDHVSYPNDGRTQEDEYVAFLVLDYCTYFVAVHRKLYGYFHNPESIMRGEFQLREYAAIEAMQNAIRFFEEHQITKQVGRVRFRYLTILRCLYVKTAEYFPEEKERMQMLMQEYQKHLPLVLEEVNLQEDVRNEFINWETEPIELGGINYWFYVENDLLPV